jgi:hypothetical protein
VPGGEVLAARLSLVSMALAVVGLLLAEILGRKLNTAIGR